MPELALKRPSDVRGDGRRAYRVYLDGERIGKIRAGEKFVTPVDLGPHALQLKIDWTASEKVNFEVNGDDRVEFMCKPGWTTPWEAFKLMTWGRGRYIDLRRAD